MPEFADSAAATAARIEENRRRALARLASRQPALAALTTRPVSQQQVAPPLKPAPVTPATKKLKVSVSIVSVDAVRLSVGGDHTSAAQQLAAFLGGRSQVIRIGDGDSWQIPLAAYRVTFADLQRHCKQFGVSIVVVDKPPAGVWSAISDHAIRRQNFQVADTSHLVDGIDPAIRDTLLPFQRDGVLFALQRGGRVLIADDMGLGKTIQAIAVASFYRAQWPLLIVCPSSMRGSWSETLLKWMPSLTVADINTVYSGSARLDIGSVVVISYDIVARKQAELERLSFQVIIADESHVLKSSTAQRTRALLPLLQKAHRCILLSGTPALSRPSELFTQISAVAPGLFSTFAEFGIRYCDGKMNHFGWDFSGASNLDELQVVLSIFMLRRTKAQVLTMLPPKRREQVFIRARKSAVKSQSAILQNCTEDELLACLADAGGGSGVLQFWRDTAALKLPGVCQYLKDLCAQNGKFLVFAHHKEMLDGIQTLLEMLSVNFMRIDGTTNSILRHENCVRFQTDERCRVALLSITAAGVGLTLTSASLVIFAELFWQPGILIQAEDRAHRMGQQNTVVVRYLLARDTVDDLIWPMLLSKLDVLEQVGVSKQVLTPLTHHENEIAAESDDAAWPADPEYDDVIEEMLQQIEKEQAAVKQAPAAKCDAAKATTKATKLLNHRTTIQYID